MVADVGKSNSEGGSRSKEVEAIKPMSIKQDYMLKPRVMQAKLSRKKDNSS